MRRLGYIVIVLFSFTISISSAAAQDSFKPFGLPLELPPGPSTWLMGQPYGNTVGAYNFGTAWYSAGQGLHFGIDISMPCGTPLIAVADGEVIYVDNMAFGAGPHNVILRHADVNLTTLYGHLRQPPSVSQFQPVKRGQLLGYSGDPDVTCDSRPHLHFEVRSLDYGTAYNPIDYIDAPWHVLTAIGSFNQPSFQQDLTNPRQWVSVDDQPPVAFGGARLNAYFQSWPPAQGDRAPVNAPIARSFEPLPPSSIFVPRPLSYEGCCSVFWWNPGNAERLYAIDGSAGMLAGIFEWDVTIPDAYSLVADAPPPILSPDGTHQSIDRGSEVIIRRLSDGVEWPVPSGGAPPSVSPDNSQLLWQVQYGVDVPGATPPQVEIWVSNIDGQNARQVMAQPDISSRWLDGDRLLISSSDRTLTTLSTYNTRDASMQTLGTWDRLRGLSIAPGGGRLLFYRTNQPDPAEDGIYLLDLAADAQPMKMPWFGGWRWRDADSLYYIPFEPSNPVQTMAYYHIPTGEDRPLTDPAQAPFTVANGDWSVSPDGNRIAFMNAVDRRLWLLELAVE